MTYISSPALTGASRQAVMQAQARLTNLEKEQSSGTFADVGLRIGSHSGQFVSVTAERDNLQSITDDNALTSTRLSATQTALTTLQTQASSFLATLTQASSGGNATEGLQNTAAGNLSSLIATLNTSVGGQHLFGGINTAETPVKDYAAGSASKMAVDDAFQAAFGVSQISAGASSVSASDMQAFLTTGFAPLFSGTDYTTNWSSASDETISSRIAPAQSVTTSVSANNPVFQKLAQAYAMVSEFGGTPLNAQASHAAITAATSLMGSAITDLINVQAGVGVVQSTVSAATDSMSAQVDLLTSQAGTLSQLSDRDLYAIPTEISTLTAQLQASYSITAQLKQMTLASYIG